MFLPAYIYEQIYDLCNINMFIQHRQKLIRPKSWRADETKISISTLEAHDFFSPHFATYAWCIRNVQGHVLNVSGRGKIAWKIVGWRIKFQDYWIYSPIHWSEFWIYALLATPRFLGLPQARNLTEDSGLGWEAHTGTRSGICKSFTTNIN